MEINMDKITLTFFLIECSYFVQYVIRLANLRAPNFFFNFLI